MGRRKRASKRADRFQAPRRRPAGLHSPWGSPPPADPTQPGPATRRWAHDVDVWGEIGPRPIPPADIDRTAREYQSRHGINPDGSD